MKRSFLALAAILLMATDANAGLTTQVNKYTILKTAGLWTAYAAKNTTSGTGLCGMFMRNPRDGRTFYIKFTTGRTFMQLWRPQWKLEDYTEINITVQFDKNEPQTFAGTGFEGSKHGQSFLSAPIQDKNNFLHHTVGAKVLTIGFPDGNEQPWALQTTGAREIARVFESCTDGVEKREAGATQPTKPKVEPSAADQWLPEPDEPDVQPAKTH